MRSVLILGARAPVALDHARRFAAQGWRVHVADSVACNLSAYSRHVHAVKHFPPPRYAGEDFALQLANYIHQQHIDVLIPTCEEIFFVARYRSQLPRQLIIAVDEFDKLRELHSKLTFLKLATACGIKTPQSQSVTTLQQAADWSAGEGVVLKPEYSRFGVFVRIYPGGIPKDARELPAIGNWVAQEFCHGDELCSYGIAHAGRLLAHAVYRPRYRVGLSSSFYFEPAQASTIERFVAAFAAATHFTGQLSFDWMRASDGECTVLECNPRATSGLHIFSDNARLPHAFLGEIDTCITPADTTAPRMIAALMLTAGLAQSFRNRQVRLWQQDYARARDVISIANDRRPLFGGLSDLASYARASIAAGCTMREIATRDIEWDGQPISSKLCAR